jgi:hypothetical protein
VKLFGSRNKRPDRPASQRLEEQVQHAQQAQPSDDASAQGEETLERTLAQFESMPQEMSELRTALSEVLHKFEFALGHLGIEAKRLSNESSALALMADKLQMRLEDLQRTLNGDALQQPSSILRPTPREDSIDESGEPQFRPSDQGVNVVLASVPGFQGLMDVQRALTGMAESDGASVVGYRNGEASLQLTLRRPVSTRRITDALAIATGEELLIEESRPDAQRLRLRFVEGESRR